MVFFREVQLVDRECCGVLSVSGGASANEKLLAWYESLSEVG